MKIALLCRNPQLYSHQRLMAAARDRGHEIDAINHLRCTIDIASHRPNIHYQGRLLTGYDAVIPRIGASVTFFAPAIDGSTAFSRALATVGPSAGTSRTPAFTSMRFCTMSVIKPNERYIVFSQLSDL